MLKGFKTTGLLFKEAFQGWSDDNIPRLGASIAFYTVFSLAPLLIIAIAIAGLAFGEQATQGKVVHEFAGLLGHQGAQAVEGMIKNAYHPRSGLIATGIGLAALFIGATGVFVEIQSALNFIWAVKPLPGRTIRTMLRQRFLSAAMIMGIAFMLLVSLIVSAALTAVGTFLSDALPGGAQVWLTLNFLISLGVNTALFALIYKLLPDVKIAWRDVGVGALITAVLFTIGKHAIGLYLGNGSISSVYGAAGSVIVILVWVYYSAQILLWGAEFTKVYTNRVGVRVAPKKGAALVVHEQEQAQVQEHEADQKRKAG